METVISKLLFHYWLYIMSLSYH